MARRVAHPERYAADGLAVEDVGWYRELENATFEAGYEVTIRQIAPSVPSILSPEEAGLSAALEQAAQDAPGTPVSVFVAVAGLETPPPLPYVPSRRRVSEADHDLAADELVSAIIEREGAFSELTQELRSYILAADGNIDALLWQTQTIVATLPAGVLTELADRPDVASVRAVAKGEDGGGTEPEGDPVPLGTLRQYTGSDAYDSAGYHGQTGGGGTELLLGVIESKGYEDEACVFGDWNCSPSARVRDIYACDASSCWQANGFGPSEGPHGTEVASIALGDYEQGQASGYESSIAPGLTNWEQSATGFAREAEMRYLMAGDEAAKATAYFCASNGVWCGQAVDVINASNGIFDAGRCDAASWKDIEEFTEYAWDQGVLPVVITHNDGEGPLGECDVRSPADIPKALAVGAVSPDETQAYGTWPRGSYSNYGGGSSTIASLTYDNAMSMVDLVASGRPGYSTTRDSAHSRGLVRADGPYDNGNQEGTSWAGPQVAGAAIQVKHRWLNLGQGWIDDPGRLHVVMLSMGDRGTAGDVINGATNSACIVGNRINCGADRSLGLGRLKLRFHDAFWMRTNSFTSTSQVHQEIVFGAPIGTGKKIFKCVMQQREDMVAPNKGDISGVELAVQIRTTNGSGACAVNEGSFVYAIQDTEPDDKHMVAILDSVHNIEGMCMQLIVDPWAISSAGSITTHTYCYADNELDY